MPDEWRDRYLEELDHLLPFPPERRAEVVEEISSHLDDAVADRMGRGIPADRAEADAQTRLGVPRDLARELARPEQSAWRLLAAAGAGVRTGVGYWIYGYLFGALLVYLVLWALFAAAQLLHLLLGGDWFFGTTDQGWTSLMTAGAVAVGLYFAGRAATEAISVSSRRLLADVRPWIVGTVTALAFALLVFVIRVPHNWASVVGFALAPAAVALGAYRPGLLPRRIRLPFVIIALFAAVAVVGLGLASGSDGATDQPVLADGPADGGISMVGPRWVDTHPIEGEMFSSSGLSFEISGAVRYEWRLADGVSLAGLTDLRAEAWRADPARPLQLHPGYDEPFAVASVERIGETLRASLITTNEPGVFAWELILTGVGPDGRRYVLDSGTGEMSTFTGSAWDWIVAVTD